MNYKDVYNYWLSNSSLDDEIRNELESIKDDDKEIKERFYNELAFGTGGLRGIIAAGSDRMNIYTVRKATQGICEEIKSIGEDAIKKGVVISYDSRHKSYEFALESAKVIAANGIKAYLFDELRPTPELSFAVRYLNCARGIMITASHNPKQYNGYKVYGEDGGQLPPESADRVVEFMRKIDIFNDVKVIDEKEANDNGLIEIVGEEIDKVYLENVLSQSINSEPIKNLGDDFKVIYSPFHGTGNKPVRKILEMLGCKNVRIVKEQELPDPEFSTVKSPNPEEKEGFNLAIEMAKKEPADIIFATDPDGDRLGVIVKNSEGDYVTLNGNQIGVLLCEYILRNKKLKGTLSKKGAVIKTIVTTAMIYPVANDYSQKVYDVLTGFKFIGEKIKEFEEGILDNEYVFGFEESYGYLAGTYCRDKDAVVAAMLVTEMAADYKQKGMTLYDAMMALYEKYGWYSEKTISLVMPGLDGANKIKQIMADLRAEPPTAIGSEQVVIRREYMDGTEENVITGEKTKMELFDSNVVSYVLADGTTVIVRPSGTEPKIKIYILAAGKNQEECADKVTEYTFWANSLKD